MQMEASKEQQSGKNEGAYLLQVTNLINQWVQELVTGMLWD